LTFIRALRIAAFIAILLALSDSWAGLNVQGLNVQGLNVQGLNVQGLNVQGLNVQGLNVQGLNVQGLNVQGLNVQGLNVQGLNVQGLNVQGLNVQGLNVQGLNVQGLNVQGLNVQGLNVQGLNVQGLNVQGTGIDRARDLLSSLTLQGVEWVGAPSASVQGLEGSAPISYQAGAVAGPILQAGPDDTNAGSFIDLPGIPNSISTVANTLWNMVFTDTAGGVARVPIYIANVERDAYQNSSKYPSNADVFLYTVYFRQPSTGHWTSLCPVDPTTGHATAMAVPLNPRDWTGSDSRAKFGFACTGSGVAAKCARNWGYKPWKTVPETVWNGTAFAPTPIELAPFYDACIISARADYCQDDHSYTKNGTLVDLFDTLDGFTSINSTVGLPYAPYSAGVMMHEEYQISALDVFPPPPPTPTPPSACTPSPTPGPHLVSENFTCDELMSMQPDEHALVSSLRRSGMETSRYADLDPGRTCAAAPYIDRCDPKEPYACYRAANLNANAYGAFLAVNSPRHCSHDEEHDGEALDPLCNECVNRVCQIDPSCCGDPGTGFYPGSLVWDGRCTLIRQSVCRSDASGPLWPAGATAPPAGSTPVVFLSGAIGAFEGFTTDAAGTTYAEGWACDPDHPEASVPVQISVGGSLGAGTTLLNAMASQVLAPSWKETVTTECGGGARHGFRVPLPSATAATDVYVYGIDLDVPGAPFSLLRGGKKTLAAPPLAARAAIWTGWIEPSASGNYQFCRGVSGSCAAYNIVNPLLQDWFRIWVDGVYADGNWKDGDPTVPGAFALDPPLGPPGYNVPRPTLALERGVRYAVRVEYLRPSADASASELALYWNSPDGSVAGLGSPQSVPPAALHPMAQTIGTGLRGTYYARLAVGDATHIVIDDPGAAYGVQTVEAVDYLWTGKKQPVTGNDTVAPGLSVGDSFSAVFEGDLVPPLSGDYTFTAATDGAVRIFVDGQLATDGATRAPDPADPAVCLGRDICQPGQAISRTCNQGGFCSAQICLKDPYCCAVTWDAGCIKKVADVCHLDCSPAPPLPVTLRAGAKVRIRVEYQHVGTVPGGPTVHGGELSVKWALADTLRDTIPAERLIAEAPAASGLGVGINAAYFSDDKFQDEILDHVEAPLAFLGNAPAPPGPVLTTSLICADAACGAGAPPDAPALVAATSTGAGSDGVTVVVAGRGAVDGASVEIAEGAMAAGGFVPATSLDTIVIPSGASATTGGLFTTTATLGKGAHELAARQTVGGQPSAWSAPLDFQAADPTAPPPPSLASPVGGFVTASGALTVSGTATPGATVTVKVGATTVGTFTAAADGRWSGTVTLPGAGGYTLTVTDTVSGVESTSATTASARVALPVLTVTSPTEGACIDATPPPGSPCTTSLTVQGAGAVPALGNIQVADGDGRYFAPPRASIPLGAAGAFSGSGGPPLDYGRHEIKIYQQTGAGDDAGVVRTVLVKPPVVASLGAPTPNAIVDAAVTVVGQGLPRTALLGTAIVYQGGQQLGQATIASDGSFQVLVQISGAGPQTLDVTQTASSLAGAGAAESDPVEITVVVKPPAPTITSPATGSAVPGPDIAVAGTALPNASVTVAIDGAPQPVVTADGGGAWATTLAPPDGAHPLTGTHRLTATQTLAGASGPPCTPVLVAVGDVTPPTIRITNADGTLLRELVVTAADSTGANVDFSARVSAQDCVAGTCTAVSATCLPASGTRFQLGTTSVTCTATDDAKNTGSSSFLVTVKPAGGPIVEGANLVAEAQGPDGAAVAYQVTATGYLADCAPPGSTDVVPCASWRPAYSGLGFTPYLVAIDTNDPTVAPDGKRHGGLYGLGFDPIGGQVQVLKSADGGGSWQRLPTPWFVGETTDFLVGAGSPPSLYVAAPCFGDIPCDGGLKVSRDGGQSWTTALDNRYIEHVWADPTNPAHMFAAEQAAIYGPVQPAYLYETHDAWATWANASTDGLPGQVFMSLAIDPTDSTRLYATLAPAPDELERVQIYRKIGAAPWQHLDLPPYPDVLAGGLATVAIAPTLDPDQTFPTVFAGPVYSRDGGETWQPHFLGTLTAVVFDRSKPGALWAAAPGNMFRSEGFDAASNVYPFSGMSFFSQPVDLSIVQDAADPGTLYSAYPYLGLYKTTNAVPTADALTLWTPVLAPGISLPDTQIEDLAFDPVDPRVAYLVSLAGGVFRTDDGADSWKARDVGLDDPLTPTEISRIAVDQFNRNNAYVGGPGGIWKSPDGPGTPGDHDAHWTQLSDLAFLGVDPFTPDTVYGTDGPVVTGDDCDGNLTCLQNLLFADGANYFRIHNGVETDDTLWFDATFFFNYNTSPNPLKAFRLQFLPGAKRSLLATFLGAEDGPRSVLFTPEDLLVQGVPLPGHLDGMDTALLTTFVFADASGGAPTLYAAGDGFQAFPDGQGPILYRTSPDGVRGQQRGQPATAGWQPISDPQFTTFDGGDTEPISNFHRLLIDPASGGQVMYTVGVGNTTAENTDTLWESHDGGRTWRRDSAISMSNIWLSPVDGSIYATKFPDGFQRSGWNWISPIDHTARMMVPPPASDFEDPIYWPGSLWKRTVAQGTPAGARVVLGDLRPVCTGGDGARGVGPGSTFPIGTTTLTCTATDAFGITTPQTVVITVQDTTPPVLQVPAQATGTAQPGGTAAVTFTVTATDAVDGDRPVTCAPASGSDFPIGVTTVACTASDTSGHTASASFPVLVYEEGGPLLTPPTLTTPGDVTAEATGSNGATVALAVTAVTGGTTPAPLTPSCSAPLGQGGATVTLDLAGSLFPLGATDVTCQATDASAKLTMAASFRVTVKDTTAPVLTIPADIAHDAEGAWGLKNVTFAASANDAVDGAVTPSCTPETGSTFPVGTTLVTCRAADRAGNRATSTFHVTISGLPPSLVLADTIAQATDRFGAHVTFNPEPQSTDTAGHTLTVDCLPPDGSVFPMGDTTVTCSASDGVRESRGSFVVHVVDQVPPAVTVSAPATVEATGPGGASVAFAASASDAVDGACAPSGPCSLVCARATGVSGAVPVTSPTLLAIGTSTVTCTATDAVGNASTASFSVVVRDTTPPTLTLPAPITVQADTTGTAVVTFAATAIDLVGGAIPVGCEPKPGSRFVVGTTAVACSARDAAGNESSGTFNVTVRASTLGKPCVSDPSCGVGALCIDGVCCENACGGGVTSDCQACSIAAGGSADGLCTAVSAGHVCRGSTGACDAVEACDGSSFACPADALYPNGTVCAAGDKCHAPAVCSGSVATCPAPAPIPCCDKTAPVFSNVPGPILAFAPSVQGVVVTYPTPKATDAADGDRPVICKPTSGSMFAPGKTTVTCTATDTCGNTATATFTVWVQFQAPAGSSFFLQPINPDGTSIFKLGSTIPTKFALTGTSAGITNLAAKLYVAKVSNLVDGSYVEAVSTAASDSGNTFRYDATGEQYIFNLSTKGMSAGTWSLRADLGDLVTHTVEVSLR
jgi:hypothetical protein